MAESNRTNALFNKTGNSKINVPLNVMMATNSILCQQVKHSATKTDTGVSTPRENTHQFVKVRYVYLDLKYLYNSLSHLSFEVLFLFGGFQLLYSEIRG